ncbi:hypothetical protein CORC01_12627 [Colletotrichum orchidophilum]|uniref:Cell wall protein n=1 Tax=Colletotrichum orchidophilum TaxID=1209926 RepID=A0A1G4ASF6_9PEZI|nr:uncharacterized protein CORC01_12627 [Colletotrichum orchidophilum]OHE92046.1 hypothetical protein CORC01_12627 [Colletotrichum orchidophilum]
MQSKIFTAALAAISFTSVQGAVLPRATITPGTIVTPGLSFDPAELGANQLAFATLQLLSGQLAQTTALAGTLALSATGTATIAVNQVQAVVAQLSSNAAAIASNVASIVASVPTAIPSPPPAPSPTAPALPDIGGQAEAVVRQAQALARTLTAQIAILQAQVTANAGTIAGQAQNLILVPALAQAQTALTTVLATIGTASNLALTTAATLTANVQAIADRIRNAQVKLNPVLVLGATPDIQF